MHRGVQAQSRIRKLVPNELASVFEAPCFAEREYSAQESQLVTFSHDNEHFYVERDESEELKEHRSSTLLCLLDRNHCERELLTLGCDVWF